MYRYVCEINQCMPGVSQYSQKYFAAQKHEPNFIDSNTRCSLRLHKFEILGVTS